MREIQGSRTRFLNISWYITESMTASRKGGVFILKKRRPHPIVSVVLSVLEV
jgi:hypothetical protein